MERLMDGFKCNISGNVDNGPTTECLQFGDVLD